MPVMRWRRGSQVAYHVCDRANRRKSRDCPRNRRDGATRVSRPRERYLIAAQGDDRRNRRTRSRIMADTIRILVADDQADILNALKLLLSDEGYDVVAAQSPAEALERLEASDFDLALLDLNYTRDTTSGQEGFDLIERIRMLDPTLPVLVMTAWSSVAGAVEAMRRGARDYIEKPWDDDKLMAAVRTQSELRRAIRRNQRLQEANARLPRGAAPAFVGDAPSIVEVRHTIERIAPSDASVL